MGATLTIRRVVVVGREITKKGLRMLVPVEVEVWSNRGYVLLIISTKKTLIVVALRV